MNKNQVFTERGIAASPNREIHASSKNASISVCIVCRDEADKLRPCLESVQWADEILLMDLSSTDSSAAMAREYGAQLIVREPLPIVERLRNEIAEHAHGEWILALDPDERVTPGLARALRQLAAREDLDAIVIPRMNCDLGYPPSHPLHRYEPQLRMYRRGKVQWPLIPNKLPLVAENRKYRLPSRDDLVLVHERSRNIPEVLDRVMRYAPAQAQSMLDRGQVFTAHDMLITLGHHSYRQFVQGQPWRDGVPGILRASFMVLHHFYVWAAFWQLSGARRTAADDRVVRRVGYVVQGAHLLIKVAGVPFRFAKRRRRRA